jgi:hypothetical protein
MQIAVIGLLPILNDSIILLSRLSSMNWARIYNMAHANPYTYMANNPRAYSGVIHKYEKHPTSWQMTFEMPDKHVTNTNGCFLYSLLLDRAERGLILQLQPDKAS